MRINPEYMAAFVDYVTDEDFDPELLALDVELTCFDPPAYDSRDDEGLLARLPITGVKLA